MTQAIIACPFCLGRAFVESPSLGRSHWNVICDDCGASGPHGHDEDQALRRWGDQAAIADRSATAPRRETGVAHKGESGGAGTAIAQGQAINP